MCVRTAFHLFCLLSNDHEYLEETMFLMSLACGYLLSLFGAYTFNYPNNTSTKNCPKNRASAKHSPQ